MIKKGLGIFLRGEKKRVVGDFLLAGWLTLHSSSAGSMGSIPGQGIKITHAVQCGPEIKKNKKDFKTVCLTFSTILLSELMKRNNLFLLDTFLKNYSEFYPIAEEALAIFISSYVHFFIHSCIYPFIHFLTK